MERNTEFFFDVDSFENIDVSDTCENPDEPEVGFEYIFYFFSWVFLSYILYHIMNTWPSCA